jgi:hypothetical protein
MPTIFAEIGALPQISGNSGGKFGLNIGNRRHREAPARRATPPRSPLIITKNRQTQDRRDRLTSPPGEESGSALIYS